MQNDSKSHILLSFYTAVLGTPINTMSYPKYDRVTAYGMSARDNGYTVRLKKDITALGHLSFTLFVLVLCLFSGWLGSAGVFG